MIPTNASRTGSPEMRVLVMNSADVWTIEIAAVSLPPVAPVDRVGITVCFCGSAIQWRCATCGYCPPSRGRFETLTTDELMAEIERSLGAVERRIEMSEKKVPGAWRS